MRHPARGLIMRNVHVNVSFACIVTREISKPQQKAGAHKSDLKERDWHRKAHGALNQAIENSGGREARSSNFQANLPPDLPPENVLTLILLGNLAEREGFEPSKGF